MTWIELAFGLWALVLLASVVVPTRVDEAWFLVVVRRVRSGERLYRDVFYGAGPTPVWLALGAVSIGGVELAVVRAVSAGVTATTAAAAAWLTERSGAGPIAIVTVTLAVVLTSGCASHWTDNLYGELTRCGTVLGLALAVAANGAGLLASAGAGLAAAMALTSKHSAGIPAAIGIGVTLVASAKTPGVVGVFLAAAVVGALLAFAPVIAQGAATEAWRRMVVNKSSYLATSRVSLLSGFREVLAVPEDGWRTRVHHLILASAYAGFAAVLLALSGAVWTAAVGGAVETVAVICTLGAVWAALIWPAADHQHVQTALAVPVLALVLVVAALDDLNAIDGLVVDSVIGALFAWVLVLGAMTVVEGRSCLRAPYDRGLPHCARVLVDPAMGSEALPSLQRIEAVAGTRVMLLGVAAPVWYLLTDLSNPTPYDYPVTSTFGPFGQGDVARQIERGDVEWVASPGPLPEGWAQAPVELERSVEEYMLPVLTTPTATLYRNASRRA